MNSLKTLKEAETMLKTEWAEMCQEQTNSWEKVKLERKKQFHNELKKWKQTIKEMLSGRGTGGDSEEEKKAEEDSDDEDEDRPFSRDELKAKTMRGLHKRENKEKKRNNT